MQETPTTGRGESNAQPASAHPDPRELLVGPYRSGKTLLLINDLLEQAQNDPLATFTVIVPSQRPANLFKQRVQKVLRDKRRAGSGQHGIFGLRVLQFEEVLRYVLNACGITFRVLPDRLRPQIVGEVMNRLSGCLKSLGSVASLPGTQSAVLELIDSFQRAGYSPADVSLSLSRQAHMDSRYNELARIYQEYWNYLDEIRFLDKRRLAFSAREALLNRSFEGLDLGWVAVDGFDRFSRLQLQVLDGLAPFTVNMKVLFDFNPDSETTGPEYQWKESSWSNLTEILGKSGRLEILPEKKIPGAGKDAKTEIFSSLDRFEEMTEIARAAKQALLEGSTRPSDILVVARDLKAYSPAIEYAFGNAEVSYYVDDTVELKGLPVVRALMKLLGLESGNYKRSDVISVLRNPCFNLKAVGLSDEKVDEIDRLSWKHWVVEGREQWLGILGRHGSRYLARAVGRFFDVVDPLKGAVSSIEWCSWLEGLIDKVFDWKTGDDPSGCFDYDPRLALREIRRITGDLLLEDDVSRGRLSPHEFHLGRLEKLLESANYPRVSGRRIVEQSGLASGWHEREKITICGAELAPNRGFEKVFIAGLVEGEFPRRVSKSGFVSAEEVARWSSFGLDISDPRNHPGYDLALFDSLRDRAKESVHLSFPRYEINGEETVPSFLINHDREGADLAGSYRAPYFRASLLPASPCDAIRALLWQDGERDLEKVILPGRAEGLKAEVDVPLKEARARIWGGVDSPLNGYLSDLVVTGSLRITLPEFWSASALNSYGQCPFRYWSDRVLKLERRDERREGLTARLAGQTYHKALEIFYNKLIAEGLRITALDGADVNDRLGDALSGALEWLEAQEEFRPGKFWQYERLEIRFRLERFLANEVRRAEKDKDGFKPGACEARFGFDDEKAAPPLTIEGGCVPIRVRGIIDRIDLAEGKESPDRVQVVDYKSSSASIPVADAREGRNIQIPLYALAVERSIFPGATVVSGAYLSVGSGKRVGRIGFLEDKTSDILSIAESRVREAVKGVKDGDFRVSPKDRRVCENCDYLTVCRITELEGGANG